MIVGGFLLPMQFFSRWLNTSIFYVLSIAGLAMKRSSYEVITRGEGGGGPYTKPMLAQSDEGSGPRVGEIQPYDVYHKLKHIRVPYVDCNR